jgi:Flp pilus assembly protein TadG
VTERGSAAVEFAMLVPLVIVVLVGVVEVAVAARAQLQVSHAAREGAREAATAPDPERAIAVVKTVLGPDLAAGARVVVERDHRVGGRADVTVTTPHRVAGAFLGGFAITLRGTASMRVER